MMIPMADSPLGDKWVKLETTNLLRLAGRLQPEGEGLDLTDQEYAMEDMAELRSHLSTMRRSIDIISRALAEAWDEEYGGKVWDDGASSWKVTRAKTKQFVDSDAFYEWMATLSPERLRRLVAIGGIKVGGFEDAERQTFLDESPVNDRLSITSKPNW